MVWVRLLEEANEKNKCYGLRFVLLSAVQVEMMPIELLEYMGEYEETQQLGMVLD